MTLGTEELIGAAIGAGAGAIYAIACYLKKVLKPGKSPKFSWKKFFLPVLVAAAVGARKGFGGADLEGTVAASAKVFEIAAQGGFTAVIAQLFTRGGKGSLNGLANIIKNAR